MARTLAGMSVRIMQIVDALAAAGHDGLRHTDVMRAPILNKTTTHRLLASLVAHGLADQDADSGRYFVGMRLLSLATAAKRRFRLARWLSPSSCGSAGRRRTPSCSLPAQAMRAVCLECIEGSFPIKGADRCAPAIAAPLGIGAGSLALLRLSS